MTEEETNGRKLFALEFISMDGVIEAPHEWHFPYVGEDMVQLIGEAQGDFDALLLGRVTYDGFAAAWPNMPDAPGAEQMNGAHHYVVSNTLGTGTWDPTTVISGDRDAIARQIAAIKAQPGGGPIVTWGSSKLVPFLLEEGLLDELRLFVHPVALGSGQRLFEDTAKFPLRVAESRALSTGTMYMRYAPAETPETPEVARGMESRTAEG